MEKVLLDAGILGIFFSSDSTTPVQELFDSLEANKIEARVLKPMLCEAFFHICKSEGKDAAEAKLASMMRRYPIIQEKIDSPTINLAGMIKCQHRDRLSYIDCMNIAFCLNNKLAFHTTEKCLKQILPETRKRLRVVSYTF